VGLVRSPSADLAEISEIRRPSDTPEPAEQPGSSASGSSTSPFSLLNKSDLMKLKDKLTSKGSDKLSKLTPPVPRKKNRRSLSGTQDIIISNIVPENTEMPSLPDLGESTRSHSPAPPSPPRSGNNSNSSTPRPEASTPRPEGELREELSRALEPDFDFSSGLEQLEKVALRAPVPSKTSSVAKSASASKAARATTATLGTQSSSESLTKPRSASEEAVQVEQLPSVVIDSLQVVRLRVVNVLRTWIKYQYWTLQDKRTRRALISAIRKVRELGKSGEKWANNLQALVADSERAWATVFSYQSPRAYTVLNVSSVLDINPVELARQMTIAEHALFKAISPAEYLHGNYSVPERSPGLRRFIASFNRRTDWVCTEVLQAANAKQRAAVIARFIRVAEQCQRIGNYNGLVEILSALQTISIERLTKTWRLVPRLEMDCFEVLRAMMDSRGNFKTYRAVLERTALPVVPFQAVFVKDLTFVEENVSMLEDGQVNFYKFWVMGTVLARIRNCQEVPFFFERLPLVQDYLSKSRVMNEDEQYEASTQLEPVRRVKEEKKAKKEKKETRAKPRRSSSKGKSGNIDAHEGASLAPGSFGTPVAGTRGSSASSGTHSRSRSRDAATDDEISDASHEVVLQQQLSEERAKRMELERVNMRLEEALYNALKKKKDKTPKGATPQEKLQSLQRLIQQKEQEILVLRGQYDALVATLITGL